MNQPKDLDWLFKCRQCKHCYQIKADADEVRCRLKYCRYEPSDEAKKFHELQRELAFIGRRERGMSKWIAEFELEDGDTMPEHMDLNYMGAKIDFHCRPMWIPVSERLPEEYGEYLITWTTSQSKRPFIGISEGEVTNEYDHEHNRFKFEWLLEDYIKAYPNVEVIAWMPLPKPYKPQERSE